jgi:ATP-dependent RNA helicase RhlE
MSFSDLGLAPELLRAVSENAYTEPTPIQIRAIPAVLEGRDVLAGAQTGTGKTAAFVLPILQRLAGLGAATTPIGGANPDRRAPRSLVLTPTRELAAQIAESARTYGKYAPVRTQVVFGGVNINPQISGLRSGCDLLIATPGRLLDLAQQGAVNLRNVQVLVLDEADRMLDMGFIRDIRRIIKLLPERRQNLLFSATYTDDMRQLASSLLHNPVSVEVAPRNAAADRVDQSVYKVPKDHKRHLLAHLIRSGNWFQVLIFTRTKHGANRLTQQLEGAGIKAAAIHGNKSQGARTRALADFKDNRITALVATEVAARGLDIKELPHVVNYELPNVPEDYVHRIGRTARAGLTGQAVSLVSPDEAPLLRDIERLLKRPLEVSAVPEFPINMSLGPVTDRGPAADPRRANSAARPSRPQGPRRDGGGQRGRGRGVPGRSGQGSGGDGGARRQRMH